MRELTGSTAPGWAPESVPEIAATEPEVVRINERDLAGPRAATEGERAAVLSSLYRERKRLLRAKRLHGLSKEEGAYLDDLTGEINRWERPRSDDSPQAEVWDELERLAAQIVAEQAYLRQK